MKSASSKRCAAWDMYYGIKIKVDRASQLRNFDRGCKQRKA